MPTFHLEDVLYGLKGFPNGIQDLADYVDVLLTLRRDRDQRNRRRPERRDALVGQHVVADGSISEDEDSGALTPIIESFKELASVETFEAQKSMYRTRDKEADKVHQSFSDQAALQRTTQIMQDDSFPPAIFDLALNKRSPPLSYSPTKLSLKSNTVRTSSTQNAPPMTSRASAFSKPNLLVLMRRKLMPYNFSSFIPLSYVSCRLFWRTTPLCNTKDSVNTMTKLLHNKILHRISMHTVLLTGIFAGISSIPLQASAPEKSPWVWGVSVQFVLSMRMKNK